MFQSGKVANSKLTTKKLLIILSSVFVVLAATTITLVLLTNKSSDSTKTDPVSDAKLAVSLIDRFAPENYFDETGSLTNIKDSAVKNKIEAKLRAICGNNYYVEPYSNSNYGIGDTISGYCTNDRRSNYSAKFAYRLSDGEDVQFNDLFIDPSKIYPYLAKTICYNIVWEDVFDRDWSDERHLSGCDEDLLNRTLAEFTVDGIQPGQFYYSVNSIVVSTKTMSVVLDMNDMTDNIAIYKRFKNGSLTTNTYAKTPSNKPFRFVFSLDHHSANYISDLGDSTAGLYIMADISRSFEDSDKSNTDIIKQHISQYIKDQKTALGKELSNGKSYLIVAQGMGWHSGFDDVYEYEMVFDGGVIEILGDNVLEQIAATTRHGGFGGQYHFIGLADQFENKNFINESSYVLRRNERTGAISKSCDIILIQGNKIRNVFPESYTHVWDERKDKSVEYYVDDKCRAIDAYLHRIRTIVPVPNSTPDNDPEEPNDPEDDPGEI